MDPRERYQDLGELIRVGVERHIDRLWTAMPVVVVEDSDGFTVKLQPTIKGQMRDPATGALSQVEMPYLGSCPVQFASGGGFTITHPIKQGDEGIALFAARCIDGWWDKGGIQPQLEYRRHNLSDAIYIPGIRSKPRALGGNPDATPGSRANGSPPSTTSVQIRSDDGKFFIDFGASGSVTIQADTLTINAATKVHLATPILEVTGHVREGVGSNSTYTLGTHTHGGGSKPDPNT